nr:transcript Y 14 [Homo sapiens]
MGQSFSCSLHQRRVGESEATLRWTEIFSWGGASGELAARCPLSSPPQQVPRSRVAG